MRTVLQSWPVRRFTAAPFKTMMQQKNTRVGRLAVFTRGWPVGRLGVTTGRDGTGWDGTGRDQSLMLMVNVHSLRTCIHHNVLTI